MKDPERLSSGRDATAFERGLLDAARNERIPEGMKRSMERALGFSSVVAMGAAGAGSAAVTGTATTSAVKMTASTATKATKATMTTGAKVGATLGVKVGMFVGMSAGVLVLGLCGGLLGTRLFGDGPPASAPSLVTPRASAPAMVAAMPAGTSLAMPAAETSAPAPAEPSAPSHPASSAMTARPDTRRALERAPARRAPSPATAGTSSDLRVEIGLIDAARDALQARSSTRALEVLRRYDTRFPHGALAPEAVALRIEALVQAGQPREARALAGRFLAENPTSPLGPRIESLAGAGPAP